MTLMHVVAMTRALGALQSAKGTEPEIFRWTDGGESYVTGTFVGGKLAHHELFRPGEQAAPAAVETRSASTDEGGNGPADRAAS